MANVNTKAHVLVRDGFVCQYCGKRLYLGQGVKLLDQHVPGLKRYHVNGKYEPLRSWWATVDHIIPEAEGGMDVLDNLAACCVVCNSRKGKSLNSTARSKQPRNDWDGLSGVFLALAPQYEDCLSPEDEKWRAALQREGVQPKPEGIDAAVEELRGFESAV